MQSTSNAFKPGKWVILRSLPPHRARWEGKPALITPDGELREREIKNWNGSLQRMLGFKVVPQGRDASKPMRVPLVCVYPTDVPLDRHGNPVQMGEQAVVRSEGRAPTGVATGARVTNIGTTAEPILQFDIPAGGYAPAWPHPAANPRT